MLSVYFFPSDVLKDLEVVPLQAVMVIVSLSGLVACLAYSAPISPHRIMLRLARQLHLVHGVFLTEQFPAASAVNRRAVASQRQL
jgi:hypothetical protein